MIKPIQTQKREVVLTRVFDAPREKVFQAWTEPARLTQWFGPDGFTNPVCEVDLQPGGVWRHVMRGPDGNDYPMTAVFHEIVPPERLIFTCFVPNRKETLFEILNTLTLVEQGGKTKMTLKLNVLKSTPAAAPMLAGMETGWAQSFEHLAEFLAKA